MTTLETSINYEFTPDKDAKELCQNLCTLLVGNGVELSDITASNYQSFDVTVNSQFIWAIKVSLKSKTLSDNKLEQSESHSSEKSAQLAAKKQGQYILQNSLGKIELVNNIQEDPHHYFKHNIVKLSGGPSHAYVSKCDAGCQQGLIRCGTCKGIGSTKAKVKQGNFLATTTNISGKDACPSCHGRGKIVCSSCDGSGKQTKVFEVYVEATRQNTDSVETSNEAKAIIEKFIKQHSHAELLDIYLSPTVSRLEDIDNDHCAVTYTSKTKSTLIDLTIGKKTYAIIGFGNRQQCIQHPPILDDILYQRINNIIGFNPAFRSTNKCVKLNQLSQIKRLFQSSAVDSSADKAAITLEKQCHKLLSRTKAEAIISKLYKIKKHLTPRYSLLPWFIVTIITSLSGFYFSLESINTYTLAIIIASHCGIGLLTGYFSSKLLTSWRRQKLKSTQVVGTLEKLPAIFSALLIIAATLSPSLLSNEQRWQIFFEIETYKLAIGSTIIQQKPPADKQTIKTDDTNNTLVRDSQYIKRLQLQLYTLGYKSVDESGEFDETTRAAITDFRKKLNITANDTIDIKTAQLLTKYYLIKSGRFDKKAIKE